MSRCSAELSSSSARMVSARASPGSPQPAPTWAWQAERRFPTDFLDEEDQGELLDGPEPTEAPPAQNSHPPPAPTEAGATPAPPTPASAWHQPTPRRSRALSWAPRSKRPLPLFLGRAPSPRAAAAPPPPKVYVTRVQPGLRAPRRAMAPLSPHAPPWLPFPGVFLRPAPLPRVQLRAPPHPPRPQDRRTGSSQATELRPPARVPATQGSREGQAQPLGLAVPTVDLNLSSEMQPVTSFLSLSQVSRHQLPREGGEEEEEEEGADDEAPGDGAASEDSAEVAEPARGRWREDAIDWQRTFSVGAVDFEQLRSDWNDLRCNVSGNLQLPEAEAVDVVAQYMERLNARHGGYVRARGPRLPGEELFSSLGPLIAQGPWLVLGASLPRHTHTHPRWGWRPCPTPLNATLLPGTWTEQCLRAARASPPSRHPQS